MAYTVDQLVTKFRQEMDDENVPYLWSDAEIIDYLDQAQKEFCRKTMILKDVVTTPVSANGSTVDIEYAIVDVRRAQLGNESRPLSIINFSELDTNMSATDYGGVTLSDWTTDTGTPRILVPDHSYLKGRLVPIPTAADTLTMWVARLSDDISAGGNFEIEDPSHQRAFLLYARGLAYLKKDSETYDEAESQLLMAEFQSRIDMFRSEQKKGRSAPRAARYGGI
jgi:hypothetical protein